MIINSSLNKYQKPFVIAEISGNHASDWDRTLRIIESAYEAGVDAIKTQAYDAESITFKSSRKEFILPSTLWKGRHLFDIYSEGSMPWAWHERIKNYCEEKNINFISTPFDHKGVDFLEKIKCKNIKIASSEANDIDFISYAASKAKNLFVSTGMASAKEIDRIYSIFNPSNYQNLVLFKCTASYPAPYEDMNLITIKNMLEKYSCKIGLSDHSLGISIPLIAYGMGAEVFEKHITLDRDDNALDSKFSLNPKEFKEMISQLKIAYQSIGEVFYGPTNSELTALTYRRSIYAIKNISKGEKFTRENIKTIRPANGLDPKNISQLLLKKSKRNIQAGYPILEDDLS